MPRLRAKHEWLQGHDWQTGDFGVQIVAPKSIIACAKSPALTFGASMVAMALMSGLDAGNGLVIAHSLESTRSMFPSTGAACLPKAIDAMAAAV